MSLRLRTMTTADADCGWMLTQQMDWPHRREDWRDALKLGTGLMMEADGQPVGTALCWRWGHEWATIGLVVVDKARQGQGIGRLLMEGLLDGLAGCNVRLHATVAGQGLYARLGFAATGEIHQYQCSRLRPIAAIPLLPGQQLRLALPDDMALLTSLDQQAHGLYRPALFEHLLATARVIMLVQDGKTVGFAAIHHFGRGCVIGPVIADSAMAAQQLISALMSSRRGEFVRIDSDPTLGLGSWLRDCGLQQVDAPVMMIRGTPWQPTPAGMSAFALMTQALA
ncbi:GNAT family N-acetyltransferase [Prodigiosinella aquatilis]|nr:GNAT family N-acetyltransferase [Prodigiosinella sp. LS101]WJV52278.1 GNAT family N-acetyltransferase [Prodigiosinella sp. LS101]WJV56632.1 GNAT family N-acetyltransferase [Pectobacteriaceae bacterium C111]